MQKTEIDNSGKTPEKVFEENFKKANEMSAKNYVFCISTDFDIRDWKKNNLLGDGAKTPDYVRLKIMSAIWSGESANVLMGDGGVDSSVYGKISPCIGDKLYCMFVNIQGETGYLMYGGPGGIRVDLFPVDKTKESFETKPIMLFKNAFDLPDEIQAFFKRGYRTKAISLMINLAKTNAPLDEMCFEENCSEKIFNLLGLEESIETSMIKEEFFKINKENVRRVKEEVAKEGVSDNSEKQV